MILLVISQNAMFTVAILYANMSTSVCSCVQTTDFLLFYSNALTFTDMLNIFFYCKIVLKVTVTGYLIFN